MDKVNEGIDQIYKILNNTKEIVAIYNNLPFEFYETLFNKIDLMIIKLNGIVDN